MKSIKENPLQFIFVSIVVLVTVCVILSTPVNQL
jgi:hypothetical protein